MKTRTIAILWLTVSLGAPLGAQFGNLGNIGKAVNKAADLHDQLTFTDQEEEQIGSDISLKLRQKYGVVQDKAVHKYVALVGNALAASSSRPRLHWTFIVLDTDGVNAFAAPGGFVHITKGALALIRNEAELADVLGHELSHITAKHTLNAIRNEKMVSLGAQATRQDVVGKVADQSYSMLLENKFDRNQEEEADRLGVTLANGLGYAPTGLGAFLTRLADRNKDLKEPSGIFASHPETQARLDALAKVISAGKLTASATAEGRYAQNISFKPVPVAAVAQGAGAASASAASGSSGGLLGLGNRAALGKENSSNQTISSAGSRGVNPDRDAKGGPNPSLVPVTVTAQEVADFKKGITG